MEGDSEAAAEGRRKVCVYVRESERESGCHKAADNHSLSLHARKAALRGALVAFYERHNPAQLADALLDEVRKGSLAVRMNEVKR